MKITDVVNKIIHGDTLSVLKNMPSESIDMIISSPPYWKLRDYGAEGQLGLEPTPSQHVENMRLIFREMKRVLKMTGTLFWNIGDSYCSVPAGNKEFTTMRSGGPINERESIILKQMQDISKIFDKEKYGGIQGVHCGRGRGGDYQEKCFLMIPERIALMAIEEGWILRNRICWAKSNPMPSPVNDRFNCTWEYVYFFVKNNKTQYWTNEKTMELVSKSPKGINGIEGVDWKWKVVGRSKEEEEKGILRTAAGIEVKTENCEGRLKKVSLWSGHDYFFDLDAVRESFAQSTVNRCAGTKIPEDQAEKFGSPRARYHRNKTPGKLLSSDYQVSGMTPPSRRAESQGLDLNEFGNPAGRNPGDFWPIPTSPYKKAHFAVFPKNLIIKPIKSGCPEFVCSKCGKPSGKFKCNCGEKVEHGIVLDPFCGSSTTGVVALKLNRSYIGIDINRKYCEMGRDRINKEVGTLFQKVGIWETK